MRSIERRLAALERRRKAELRPYRLFFCPASEDAEAFHRRCEEEAPECEVIVICFVEPGGSP